MEVVKVGCTKPRRVSLPGGWELQVWDRDRDVLLILRRTVPLRVAYSRIPVLSELEYEFEDGSAIGSFADLDIILPDDPAGDVDAEDLQGLVSQHLTLSVPVAGGDFDVYLHFERDYFGSDGFKHRWGDTVFYPELRFVLPKQDAERFVSALKQVLEGGSRD